MKTKSNTILLLFLALFFHASVHSQSVNYEGISYSEALSKAKSTKQLIFVQMVSDCEQCNKVADKSLSGEEVTELFSNFICLKVLTGSDDYRDISERFRISPHYPTSLFLNHEGQYLDMMYNRSTTLTSEYIKLAAMAIAKHKNPPLASYNVKYLSGKYDLDFLKEYISELLKYKFSTDDLLEEYVGKLTIDSFFSENKLRFLIQTAPIIDSKIHKLIRLDQKRYNEIFMSFPLEERIRINNRVIGMSRKKAYKENDEGYMRSVANFARGSHTDFQKGQKAYWSNLLDFYSEVKDTKNYIQTANNYYRRYIEKLDMDSICKMEKESFVDTKDGKRLMGGRLLKVGNQINKMAWSIYELSDDPEYLGRALKWSEKTLVYQIPAYHDTYAHILYKLGAKEKAVEWQQKAIELSDSLRRPSEKLTLELNKMKNGEL